MGLKFVLNPKRCWKSLTEAVEMLDYLVQLHYKKGNNHVALCCMYMFICQHTESYNVWIWWLCCEVGHGLDLFAPLKEKVTANQCCSDETLLFWWEWSFSGLIYSIHTCWIVWWIWKILLICYKQSTQKLRDYLFGKWHSSLHLSSRESIQRNTFNWCITQTNSVLLTIITKTIIWFRKPRFIFIELQI